MQRFFPSPTGGPWAERPGTRRRSGTARTLMVLAVALACLTAVGSVSWAKKKPAGSRVWMPAPGSQKNPDPRVKMNGPRAIFRQHGIVVQLELLADHSRSLFLNSAGIHTADPFATTVFGQQTWTFLLRLENTAEEPLTFRPPAVSLYTKSPLSVNSPCDYLCLVDAGAKAGLDDAEQVLLLKAAMDSAETLKTGDRVSKLLVFVGVPSVFKQFVIDLDGFVIGRNSLHFVMPYRAVKGDGGTNTP